MAETETTEEVMEKRPEDIVRATNIELTERQYALQQHQGRADLDLLRVRARCESQSAYLARTTPGYSESDALHKLPVARIVRYMRKNPNDSTNLIGKTIHFQPLMVPTEEALKDSNVFEFGTGYFAGVDFDTTKSVDEITAMLAGKPFEPLEVAAWEPWHKSAAATEKRFVALTYAIPISPNNIPSSVRKAMPKFAEEVLKPALDYVVLNC